MASVRDLSKRAVALMTAGLSLLTSVGFSALVVWQIKKDNQQRKLNDGVQAALEQAQNQVQAASTDQNDAGAADSSTDNQSNNNQGGTKLQGTKLADFTPGITVDSLQIIELVNGTGAEVQTGDTITAHYTGALVSDGTIFQSSLDSGKPFTSSLDNLVEGWQNGIPGMREGGTRRLIIPAAQAYGSRAQDGIPANSDLVFDIQLISIKK